jgi:hypothetical protein
MEQQQRKTPKLDNGADSCEYYDETRGCDFCPHFCDAADEEELYWLLRQYRPNLIYGPL